MEELDRCRSGGRLHETNFQGQVLDELKRLTDAGIVRLVDLAVVSKDDDGDIPAVEVSGLSARSRWSSGRSRAR